MSYVAYIRMEQNNSIHENLWSFREWFLSSSFSLLFFSFSLSVAFFVDVVRCQVGLACSM